MATRPETTGKIGQARERIREIESRIDAMRADLMQYRIERARLGEQPTGPAKIERATALDTAIKRLGDALPVPGTKPGEWRPPLQRELEQAAEELENVRRRRYYLARDVESLASLRDRLGPRLDELHDALALVYDVLRQADVWPPGLDERRLGSFRVWADQQAARIRSLPAWRANLAELGDDDGYRLEPPEQVVGYGWHSRQVPVA